MVTVTNISKHLGATSHWVEEVVDSYKGAQTLDQHHTELRHVEVRDV